MTKTREQLGAEYLAKIGYNPFEDDPTISEAEVAQTLAEYDELVAEECSDTKLIARIGNAEIWLCGNEYFVYGVTASGDPRVCPSEDMARAIAQSATL